MVTIGIPETKTLGLGTVGIATPPWAQFTTAPMCRIGPGMVTPPCSVLLPEPAHQSENLRPDDGQRAYIDRNRGTDQGDHRALSISDVNAGLVDHDHGAARTLQHNAAGNGRGRPIAKDERVLAAGLEYDILSGGNGGRSDRQDRDIGDHAPEAAHPYGVARVALLELDPDLRPDGRNDEAAGLDAGSRDAGHRPT